MSPDKSVINKSPSTNPFSDDVDVSSNGEADLSIDDSERLSMTENNEIKIEHLSDFPVFGRYSMLFLVVLEGMIFPQMANLTYMVYAGSSPIIESCGDVTFTNITQVEICAALPSLINSTGCTPVLAEPQFFSIGYEFNYICSDMHRVKNSISIQMMGILIGAAIFGQLSDLYGRRKVMIICTFFILIFNLLASIAPTLEYFTYCQFCALFFNGGINSIFMVHYLEAVPKRCRVWMQTVVSYSPNYIVLALLAYITHTWRSLLLSIGLSSIFTLVCLFCTYESPRWLVQRGRLAEAKDTYEKIERFNGTLSIKRQQILDVLIEKEVVMLEKKRKAKKYYFHHLFYTAKFIKFSFILAFNMLATTMIFYALMFNMESLSGSIYVNSAILGLIRYLMSMVFGFIDYRYPRIGRKTMHRSVYLMAIGLLFIAIIIKACDFDLPGIANVAILNAAAVTSQIYIVNTVVTGELFPTPIRNIAASFQLLFGRFGSVLAPHLFWYLLVTPYMPYLFLALVGLFNVAIFLFFIPETKDYAMTDHMPDKSERIFRKKVVQLRDVSTAGKEMTTQA